MSKKKQIDLFGDDDNKANDASEFERLLNASSVSHRQFVAGDRFRGEILVVNSSEAFVSTGTSTDAILPISENPNVQKPKVGEFKEFQVVRVKNGEILVREMGTTGAGVEVESLEDAFDMELPVEGTVLEVVKGGFRIKVQGQKAFCPISQMDFRVNQPEEYVGKKFDFLITKLERGRDLVVSRRKLLEIEKAGAEGEFLQTAKVDDVFSATVFRIEKYGAFVRLQNGIEGLVPISELSWSRINHPHEVVNLDQAVQVKLLKMEEDGDRLKISFSVKQGGSVEDPWQQLSSQFPSGTVVEGVVEGKEQFGLFVNIALGVTGLLPRAAWRDSLEANQYENKRRGDKVKVRVDKIDLELRRLSFSLPREDEDESWRSHSSVVGTNNSSAGKSKGMGSFADLLSGVTVKKP